MDTCPVCGRPYGKRRRCYWCEGRPRSGEFRSCAVCQREFYVAAYQLRDPRRAGTYCSRECKYAAMRQPRKELTARPRFINRQGYVMLPVASGRGKVGYRAEHRLVMEAVLRRSLAPTEHVHHRNGDKADNRIENLELLSNSDHQKLHDWGLVRARRIRVKCQECGKEYERKASRASETKYCSQSCRSKAVSRARWEREKAR